MWNPKIKVMNITKLVHSIWIFEYVSVWCNINCSQLMSGLNRYQFQPFYIIQLDISSTKLHKLFFFFLLLKDWFFPFGPRLGRGLQSVKKLPSVSKDRLQAEALTLGGLLKGHWAPEVPSRTSGWAFQREIVQPSLGTSQTAEVGQLVTHLLDDFHILI